VLALRESSDDDMGGSDVRGACDLLINETSETVRRSSETREILRITWMETSDVTPPRHWHAVVQRDGTRGGCRKNKFGLLEIE
jgi:hypothetical protein